MEYKKCGTCKKIKTIDHFHHNKARDDGLHNRCKECRSSDAKEQYASHPEKTTGRIAAWRQNNPDQRKASDKAWVEANRAKVYGTAKKWAKTHPEKRSAHEFVKLAIRSGKLPPVKTLKCSRCGIRQAEHYHHPNGYDKEHRLDVVPVCVSCHNDIHNHYSVATP